jgi:hypothetical protein
VLRGHADAPRCDRMVQQARDDVVVVHIDRTQLIEERGLSFALPMRVRRLGRADERNTFEMVVAAPIDERIVSHTARQLVCGQCTGWACGPERERARACVCGGCVCVWGGGGHAVRRFWKRAES